METIAFIEELGRNGEVVRRHLITKLPSRIGRSLESDVIVDDPYVAANHLEIRMGNDGALEVADLDSLNGTSRIGRSERISTIRANNADVFRIGQTQLRIRLSGQGVPPEMPLPQRTWGRHPFVLVGAVCILVGFIAWEQYVNTFSTDKSKIYSEPLWLFLILLAWSAIWSLVCHILHGRGNFIAHGIVVFLGFSSIYIVSTLTDYLNFAFDLHGFDYAWDFCMTVVIAGIFYKHLNMTVRLSKKILVVSSVFLAAILYGGFEGLPAIKNGDKTGLQSYDNSIKPSAFLLTQGVSPEQFVDLSKQLKAKVDKDSH